MRTSCICSAPTKEDLQRAINKYFLSENYIITDDNRVYNTKTEKYWNADAAIVVERKGRWQFRRVES